MSKKLSADEQEALKTFKLPNVDSGNTTHRGTAFDHSPRKLTASDVEQIEAVASKEGYQQGFEEGHRDGFIAGEAEVNAKVRKLKAILISLNKPLDDIDDEVIEQIVHLAVTVSKQIIRRELRIDPGQVMAVVREAMSVLPATARDIKIFLHPEDATLVREILSVDENQDRPWIIVDDPVLNHGGCKIQAENSFIDATIEQRLNQVIAELLGGERKQDSEQAPE